jgi:hypothetical protein
VPPARRLDRDQALAELAVRYVSSHGPATARDLRWWSSLPAADVDRGLRLAGPRLERLVVDGRTWWVAGPPPAGPAEPAVQLLQTWDEYVVGYSDTRWLADVAGAAGPLLAGWPGFNSVVVLDGQVAGRWRRTLRRDGVVVEAALHAPLDDAQRRALADAVDRHGSFLGLPATLVTRAH